MINGLVALLKYVPSFLYSSAIMIYLTDSVMKYTFKNKKRIYIISLSIGLILGLSAAYFSVYPPSNSGIYVEPKVEAYSNTDPGIEVVEDIQMWGAMITYVILAVGLREKVWKKIVVSLLAGMMLTAFTTLFDLLHGMIANMFEQENRGVFFLVFFGLRFLFMLFEFLVFKYLSVLRTKYDNVPLPIPVLLISATTFGLFVSIVGNALFDESRTTLMRIVSIIFLMMTLAGSLVFFYIRATRKESSKLRDANKANEELIAAQTRYFEASARADNEIRAIRHDMKNNIQVLSLLLENNEYDKMREYLEELGEGLKTTDVSAHTGNTIADAIIADKKAKAAEKGIGIRTSGKIAGVDISSVDMCKILSNILDNAIEAVSDPSLAELAQDLRVITLDFRSTGNFFMISSTNPCDSCPVIKDGRIETTKKNKEDHGFGLMNIESAAKDYDGEVSISCKAEPYGGSFTIEVMIPMASE